MNQTAHDYIAQRAEFWRQDKEVEREGRRLKALAKRRRQRQASLRIDQRLPTWQKWIVYPIGSWILWECLRVVMLGGKIHF